MFTLETTIGTFTAPDRATLEHQMQTAFKYAELAPPFGPSYKRKAKVALQHARAILSAFNTIDGLDSLSDDDILAALAI